MSTPDGQRPEEPTRTMPTAPAPTVSTAPAEGPNRWWSSIPHRLGRARTSTVVLAVLFVAIGLLYLYVRPETGDPAPTGDTTEAPVVPAPVPTPTPEPTPEPTTAPTPSARPTTSAPGTSGSAEEATPTGVEATTEPTATGDSGGDLRDEESEAPTTSRPPGGSSSPTS